jgi:hypothetical protein
MWKGRYFPLTADDGKSSIRFDQYVQGMLIEVWVIGGPVPKEGVFEINAALSRTTMQALWQVIEELHAWHWTGQDYGCHVLDGGPWVLEMRRGEHRASVRGNCLDAAPRGFRRLAHAIHCATDGAFMKTDFEEPSSEIQVRFPNAARIDYFERDRLCNEIARVAMQSEQHTMPSYTFFGPDGWGLGFRCDEPVVFLKAVQPVLQGLGLWEHHHAKHRPVWEDDWQEVR